MSNARFTSAIEFHRSGEVTQAIAIYIDLLLTNKSNPQLLFLLGVAYLQLDQYEQALIFLVKSIKLYPGNPASHYNLAVVLQSLQRFDEAIESYRCAIKLQPDYAEAYSNLGAAFSELKRFDEAIESYNLALELNPNYVDVYYNRGNVLCDLGRLEDALVSYDHAIQLNPNYAEAYNNRGVALRDLGRLEDALVCYDHAIQLNPNYAEAYNNRGVALRDLGRLEEAIENSDQAIKLNPNYAEAFNSYGLTLRELRRFEEALISLYKAISLKPEIQYLFGNFILTKMQLCDWRDFEQFYDCLIKETHNHKKVSTPFIVLALTSDAAVQSRSAEIYTKNEFPINYTFQPINKYPRHKKIRVAYFSADFREHPVSYLTAELFELHDREKFEVTAFSFGVDNQDNLRKRLEKGFDQFIDVKDKTDQEIAILAREMEIDIAIDLGGYTADCRTNIFAMRAAPIQLSYIGYLGTMGAEYFDYLIADSLLIPQDQKQYYSEKIVYLPSYQVNDTKREISKRIFTREEIGLPRNGFVFCCFNNIYKITPSTFDSWMRILKGVDQSVLFLLDANETATKNLKKEAEARGVSSDKLVFAKHLPLPEYLARYRIADLFLDTLPYNAGTTASDALRMGLPVLTQMGQSFASRMAASLLNAVGLPELITTTQEEYESLAISLAKNPVEIQKIKNKLAANLPASDLYNTQKFTRNIEAAYQSMYQRYQNDLPPDNIYVVCI